MIWNAILCSLLFADFHSANQLYDAGKFADAATAYEKIEPKTAHVYFNLGNALFRQEKFGLAVLNYERARRLAPRDPDILANLRFTRQRLGVEERERLLPVILGSRTVVEWSRYETAALWLTVLAVAGAVWLRRVRAGMILVAVVAGLATVVTASAVVMQSRAPSAAIVIAGAVDAHFAPTTDATVHFRLIEGSRVMVREDRGAWLLVERGGGQQGWIETEAVALVAPPGILVGALR